MALHNLISKLFSKQREYSGTVAAFNITIIIIMITITTASSLTLTYNHPERVFRHGCHLQAPLVDLQLRDGHRLVPPGQVVAIMVKIIITIIMIKMTITFIIIQMVDRRVRARHLAVGTLPLSIPGTRPRAWSSLVQIKMT